jgi:hypothetical protein
MMELEEADASPFLLDVTNRLLSDLLDAATEYHRDAAEPVLPSAVIEVASVSVIRSLLGEILAAGRPVIEVNPRLETK